MWTRDALVSEIAPYDAVVWRVIETQYKAATMRLTDTLDEQHILEMVLEESKPSLPDDCAHLDFLLATPFRYAPYPFGSRFRRANQSDGAFYGAEVVDTAVAEAAFYRLLFYVESPDAKLPANAVEHTAFHVPCRTQRHIDLSRPALDRDSAAWMHPTHYDPCQDLADMAREEEIDVIRYASVRDPQHRANVALLTCRAFAASEAQGRQTWHLYVQRRAVRAWCESPALQLEFPADGFRVDPRIAASLTAQ